MKRPDVFAIINLELKELGKSRDLDNKPDLDACADEIIDLLQKAKNNKSKIGPIELLDALTRSAAISVNAIEHYGS